MTGSTTVRHEFVHTIPTNLEHGVVYISIEHATAVHLCCCGCGHEVVTPLHPTDWRLTFDGETISLHPSIGNWSLSCASHYWIDRSRVRWSLPMTKAKIDRIREEDRLAKAEYHACAETTPTVDDLTEIEDFAEHGREASGLLARLWRRLRRVRAD